MAKIKLDTKEFEDLLIKFDRLNGDLEKAVEKALIKSAEAVTPKLASGISKHIDTGDTSRSLRKNEKVIWEGMLAYIKVGFDIGSGGYPSIFLLFGSPHQKKDRNLYNAIYGTKAKKERTEIQRKAIEEYLEEVLSGK